MRRILFFLFAAIVALIGCTKNNDIEPTEEEINLLLQEAFDRNEGPSYEVISEERLTPAEMADWLFGTDGNIDDEQVLESKIKFLERCNDTRERLCKENPDNEITPFFHKSTFEYKTVDQFGNPITLSAFMAYGEYWKPFKYLPMDQDHIILCCPYTHTMESECATESGGGFEFKTMLHDNLFIMPDGQGFGSNKDHVQTYLNHSLHARQYYDALDAGYKLYVDNGGKFESNFTLRVVGASQGAGDAIAVHKYADTTNERVDLTPYFESGNMLQQAIANALCKRFGYPKGTKIIDVPRRYKYNFEYSLVCCGPYSPETTMRTYHDWGKLSYPCVIPLVIKSMLACNPELSKKYDETDFFSDQWNAHKAEFDDIFLKKPMNADNVNIKIVLNLGMPFVPGPLISVPLDKMLSKEMMDPNSQICKDLMDCLKKQDLTSGWTPITKTKVCFTPTDDVVPYSNTEELFKLFGDKCEKEEITCTGHIACCTRFMIKEW